MKKILIITLMTSMLKIMVFHSISSASSNIELCTRQKKKLAEIVCIIWIFAKTRPCTTSTSYTAF